MMVLAVTSLLTYLEPAVCLKACDQSAFSRISADELISTASMASAMKKAGAISGKYKPPNQ
jgi:hypothetical protein